jgi:hypothetical protein
MIFSPIRLSRRMVAVETRHHRTDGEAGVATR